MGTSTSTERITPARTIRLSTIPRLRTTTSTFMGTKAQTAVSRPISSPEPAVSGRCLPNAVEFVSIVCR